MSARHPTDPDQKMAPRFPRPVTVLPGSRLQRPEEGARCYKKCTRKSSMRRAKYECVEAMRRQLKCCRRKIEVQPTEKYAAAISQELRTVFK